MSERACEFDPRSEHRGAHPLPSGPPVGVRNRWGSLRGVTLSLGRLGSHTLPIIRVTCVRLMDPAAKMGNSACGEKADAAGLKPAVPLWM
jgi:hypothetical protein